MYEYLKTLHPAGFEPGIFCSGGGRDNHNATPPGLEHVHISQLHEEWEMKPWFFEIIVDFPENAMIIFCPKGCNLSQFFQKFWR
jgi:hypothetical protein